MKKTILALLLCILLTGCKNSITKSESLTCTKDLKTDILKTTEKIEIYASSDTIKKISSTLTYEVLEKTMNENIKDLLSIMKANYGNKKIQAEITEKNNTYILKAEYTPEEINKKQENKNQTIETNNQEDVLVEEKQETIVHEPEDAVAQVPTSLNEYKKMLEGTGYTCK